MRLRSPGVSDTSPSVTQADPLNSEAAQNARERCKTIENTIRFRPEDEGKRRAISTQPREFNLHIRIEKPTPSAARISRPLNPAALLAISPHGSQRVRACVTYSQAGERKATCLAPLLLGRSLFNFSKCTYSVRNSKCMRSFLRTCYCNTTTCLERVSMRK